MEKNLLTLAEVCAKLRISRSHFFKLAKKHEIPPSVRIGHRSFFQTSTVDTWLESRETIA